MLPVYAVAAMAPAIQDSIGLSAARLGAVIATHSAVTVLVSPFGGRVADVSWRRGAVLGPALVCAALCWLGLVAQAWWMLALGLAVNGTGNALTQPAGNALIGTRVRRRSQGLAFGIKQSALPASALVAGMSVPLLVEHAGWRVTLVLLAALPAAVGLTAARFGAAQGRARAAAVNGATAAAAGPLPVDVRWYVLAGAIGFTGSGSAGVFVVSYLVRAGTEPAVAGTCFALGSGLAVAIRVAAGWLTDRAASPFNVERLTARTLLVGGVAFLAMVPRWDGLAYVAVLALGVAWAWNGLFFHGLARRAPGSLGLVSGRAQSRMAAGMMIGPIVFGAIADAWGYTFAWLWISLMMTSAASMLFVIARSAPSGEEAGLR
jgi:predicted MFS family arabinose efflux permease